MTAVERLAQVAHRGRMMRLFCDRVRERGDVAFVEETVDLPRLRGLWRTLRGKAFGVARLDELGETPVDLARVAELRRKIASRESRGRKQSR